MSAHAEENVYEVPHAAGSTNYINLNNLKLANANRKPQNIFKVHNAHFKITSPISKYLKLPRNFDNGLLQE